MISIICAYNNKKILNSMLIESLKKQTYCDFETIFIDSNSHNFRSASSALNYGVFQSKGDILFFCHQDISLMEIDYLFKLKEFCKNIDFDIAGVAGEIGSSRRNYSVTSSVFQGYDKRHVGKNFSSVQRCNAVDECAFFIKRERFSGFDDFGDTWHFYASAYSLKCKKTLLFPLITYHLSPGWSLNYNYYDTLLKVGKKYKCRKHIYSTMGVFNNNFLLPLYVVYKKIQLKYRKWSARIR